MNIVEDPTLSFECDQARELDRLRAVEAAALRVASSRRDGVVTDKAVLDLLDAALEDRLPSAQRSAS